MADDILINKAATIERCVARPLGLSVEQAAEGMLRIGGVPLFTGFMYAAVGSYLVRVYRLFDLRFDRYPRRRVTVRSKAVGSKAVRSKAVRSAATRPVTVETMCMTCE